MQHIRNEQAKNKFGSFTNAHGRDLVKRISTAWAFGVCGKSGGEKSISPDHAQKCWKFLFLDTAGVERKTFRWESGGEIFRNEKIFTQSQQKFSEFPQPANDRNFPCWGEIQERKKCVWVWKIYSKTFIMLLISAFMLTFSTFSNYMENLLNCTCCMSNLSMLISIWDLIN